MGITGFGSLLSESWRWIRHNWLRTLIFSIASFVICWGWNIWLLARAAGGGGSDDVGLTDSVATSATGNGLNGLYWLFVSSICFGLFTYGRERGFANALGDVARLPRHIGSSFSGSAGAAIAMFLWGAVIGFGIGAIMPAAASGVLGVGFVLLALTPVAAVLNNILIRLFVGIVSNAAPNLRGVLAGMAAPFLMMLGEAVGLLLVMLAGLDVGPAIGIAVACGVLAFVLASSAGKAAPSPATFVFLVLVGLTTLGAFLPDRAAADDGGWAECFDEDTGEPCKGLSGIRIWWDSAGASELRKEAQTGGFFGGAGAILGATLGGLLGSAAKARGGWKLPGGGFGTQSVSLTGPDAASVLVDKGILAPAGDGAFQFVGAEGADSAGAQLKGADLGNGKVTRVAVDAPTGPDGLVRAESISIEAEVVDTKSAGFEAQGKSAAFEATPQSSDPSSRFDVAGPGEPKSGFDAGQPADAKAGFEGAQAQPGAEAKAGDVSAGAGEPKAGFEGAQAQPGAEAKAGDVTAAAGEPKAGFEGAQAQPGAEAKAGDVSAAAGEPKAGFEGAQAQPGAEAKAGDVSAAAGEPKAGFEGAQAQPGAEAKAGDVSAGAGEPKAGFEGAQAQPGAEAKAGDVSAAAGEPKPGFEGASEAQPGVEGKAGDVSAAGEPVAEQPAADVDAKAGDVAPGEAKPPTEGAAPPPEPAVDAEGAETKGGDVGRAELQDDVLPDEDRFRPQDEDVLPDEDRFRHRGDDDAAPPPPPPPPPASP